MKEAFEKLKERLEEESQYSCSHCMERAISIVSEVEAEYGKDINVLGNKSTEQINTSTEYINKSSDCSTNEKQTYEICLNGCDDDTIFKMDLTESEYKFLLRVSEIANETSYYGCMPRMYVREYTPTTD